MRGGSSWIRVHGLAMLRGSDATDCALLYLFLLAGSGKTTTMDVLVSKAVLRVHATTMAATLAFLLALAPCSCTYSWALRPVVLLHAL